MRRWKQEWLHGKQGAEGGRLLGNFPGQRREILREETLSKVLCVPWVATCGRNKQTREVGHT